MSSTPTPTTDSRKTFLHAVEADIDRRRWRRRPCSFLVRLSYPQRGIRQIAFRTARVIDISEGGAGIEMTIDADLPDHFYLALGNWEFSIAAVVVGRRPGRLNVQFIKAVPTRLVDRLSRIDDPARTLSAVPNLLRDVL